MLDKKQQLLSILKELFGIFELAESLYEYIEQNDINDEILDNLINLFISQITNISDEKNREKLQTTINKLKLLREKELHESKLDMEDAENLLNSIN